MMEARVVLKIALIGLYATSVSCNFTVDELETILSSLNLLRIGQCILVLDTDPRNVRDSMKFLGRNFISAVFMKLETLEGQLAISKPAGQTTAIVIKVKRTGDVKSLFVQNSELLHRFIWFLISEDDLDPEIAIPFNCQLFKIEKQPNRTHRLIETYHIKNNSTCTKPFGIWTPENGLTAPTLSLYRRRRDLKGVSLKITVCNFYTVEKSLQMFWKDYAKLLNYSLTIETLSAVRYGPQESDGTACLSAITDLDYEKDWIFSTADQKVKLLMKFRASHEIGWRAYIQPFTKQMWTAVGAWLLLSTAAFIIVNGATKKTLFIDAFTAFFCMCNSDPMAVHPPSEPIPTPTKLVYLMSLVVPAVIVPAYSAYILSTLSVTLPHESFKDIKGLIADGTYRLAVVNNSFARRYLKRTEDPDLKYIYEHLFEDRAPTFAELFDELCKDHKLVGLFVDDRTFRRLFNCRMTIIQQEVLTISTGMLLPTGSPLRKIFNERLTEYYERGLKQRETNSEVVLKKPFEETGALNSLDMSQMRAIFFLVPIGVFLSLIVLAAEIAHSTQHRKDLGTFNKKTKNNRRYKHPL